MGKDNIEFIQKGCSLLAYHARWNAQSRKGLISKHPGSSNLDNPSGIHLVDVNKELEGNVYLLHLTHKLHLKIYFVDCQRGYQGYIIKNRFIFMVSDYLSLWARNLDFRNIAKIGNHKDTNNFFYFNLLVHLESFDKINRHVYSKRHFYLELT